LKRREKNLALHGMGTCCLVPGGNRKRKGNTDPREGYISLCFLGREKGESCYNLDRSLEENDSLHLADRKGKAPFSQDASTRSRAGTRAGKGKDRREERCSPQWKDDLHEKKKHYFCCNPESEEGGGTTYRREK